MSVQVQIWPRGIQRVKAAGPLAVAYGGEDPRAGRPVHATDVGRLISVGVSSEIRDGFGGTDLVKFRIVPNGGYIGGMFRPGDHVRVLAHGGNVGDAELSEPVPQADGTVEFTAKGYGYNLYDYDSVAVLEEGDVSYPTTRLLKNPGYLPVTDLYGWEFAQDLGMPINQIVGDTDPMSTWVGEHHAAEAPVKIGTILTELYRPLGIRWAVWGRTLVLAGDTTTARWKVDAPTGFVGTADNEYATRVGVLYVDPFVPPDYDDAVVYDGGDKVVFEERWWVKLTLSPAGTAPGETVVPDWTDDEFFVWQQLPQETSPRDWRIKWAVQDVDGINVFDERTVVVDYRGRGPMDHGVALALAQGLLDQVKGRFVLSGSITVGKDSGFKAASGGNAGDFLAFVRAGHGLELNHVRSTQGNLIPGFQVIGKTDWSWDGSQGPEGSEQLTITPMGSVARNLGAILAGIPLAKTR